MQAFVKKYVNTDESELMTDDYRGFMGMNRVLPHHVIKHDFEYVNGDIHTNTIEGFCAIIKCGVFGSFHSVSRKHLQKYVDEFCYRYNLRGMIQTTPSHLQ